MKNINSKDNTISIIPKPIKVDIKQLTFTLTKNTVILTDPGLLKQAELLKNLIAPATGFELVIMDHSKKDGDNNFIILNIDENEKISHPEGYHLEISKEKIEILGSTPKGVFYGIQTLRQLLPVEIESSSKINREWSIPCVSIEDSPRFSWRGFMLDESRHFFGKETVKKMLDLMVRLKFNIFHWHMTDYQGWRIEIKKYKRLI